MKTSNFLKTKARMISICLASMILLISFTMVQAGEDKIFIGEKITIDSKILNEERTMLVYLPIGYEQTKTNYPVMYVLDGKTHFHHASGIVQFLSGQGVMPQTIVVAIANIDRGRDFTPTKIEGKKNTGGADSFMSFLKDELMPYVSDNYRTQPYNILVGHSLGGTFASYALLNNPDVFEAYIAISPYLMYDDNMLLAKAETDLKPSYNHSQYFYMTLGDEPKYTESVEKFAKMVQANSPEGLELKYTHMTKEDHGTIPHLSIYNGLEAIYKDWRLPKEAYEEGLARIDDHYKKLSVIYGYEINTPEYVVNLLGYNYLGKKENDKAITVFKENIKRYPASANVYDSYGEALEDNGQLADAEKNYAKAVKIAEKENHAYLKTYQDNLNRAQSTLAEN